MHDVTAHIEKASVYEGLVFSLMHLPTPVDLSNVEPVSQDMGNRCPTESGLMVSVDVTFFN
jgi:hypothetical protein